MMKIKCVNHLSEEDQITIDLSNHLCEKITNAFNQAFALSSSNEQSFHIGIKGFVCALGYAAGLYTALNGGKIEDTDIYDVGVEIIACIKTAKAEVAQFEADEVVS